MFQTVANVVTSMLKMLDALHAMSHTMQTLTLISVYIRTVSNNIQIAINAIKTLLEDILAVNHVMLTIWWATVIVTSVHQHVAHVQQEQPQPIKLVMGVYKTMLLDQIQHGVMFVPKALLIVKHVIH